MGQDNDQLNVSYKSGFVHSHILAATRMTTGAVMP
jgi:hypothetical protein